MPGIVLAYIGVHQIFQLALAAHELGELEALRCSMIAHPGKWGSRLAGLARIPSASPLGYDQLPAGRVVEHPWPLLAHRLCQRFLSNRNSDHWHSNTWFDRSAAGWLRRSKARVFVGVETCALLSMQTAKRQGMTCVLDCAGIPNAFLDRIEQEAAMEFGLPIPASSNSPAMEQRKRQELELADVILCCSDFQAEKLIETGAAKDKVRVIPLWADTTLPDDQPPRAAGESGDPLRVIYAGTVSLKKGVPYLIEAMRELEGQAKLTLVGKPSTEMRGMLDALPPHCTHLPYMAKDELRRLYAAHDVLVMPSLGDSFGFVIMEAMAAGLPVIASEHAGAPLPSPDWRVPARSSTAIAARLRQYASHRKALEEDGQVARSFAAQWTPQRYRAAACRVFAELLA